MSAVVVTSPAPRRVRTPRWLDLRLAAGVVLVLASVLLGATLINRANRAQGMWSAARDLAPGTVLRADDLSRIQVRLPNGTGRYFPAATTIVGQAVTRQVSAGELVPRSALTAADAATTVTVPLTSANAPRVQRGQRIQLWVSTKTCAAVPVLADVTVQDVQAAGTAAFASGTTQGVVIRVPSVLAARVVTALGFDAAVLRAGILSGAATSGANDNLPSLDSCAKKT